MNYGSDPKEQQYFGLIRLRSSHWTISLVCTIKLYENEWGKEQGPERISNG